MFKILAAILTSATLAFPLQQTTIPIAPEAHVLFHIKETSNKPVVVPTGLSPASIKKIYNLPSSGGKGTIAIVDAYNDPMLVKDLTIFDTEYGLPACSTANGCLTMHTMSPFLSTDQGWALEESLDVEWAHAIAPNAKILLVMAKSSGGQDLLNAVAYAAKQKGVVAVSMSWGADEFAGESFYDSYFTTKISTPITFFASSGDSGNGVLWPAVSTNVVGVGGTSLHFTGNTFTGETAWSESGGGVSAYETEPLYQSQFNIAATNGMRAVPDTSFDADPSTGVAVYDSFGYDGQSGWFQVGGTSLGSPVWAAIRSLGSNFTASSLYTDALASPTDFRDIVSGSNGSCAVYCAAGTGYDYITGLGIPLTVNY